MKKTFNFEKMAVRYVQKGSGYPIIFLHGWGQSSESFESSIKYLASDYEVFALDLPGFGQSDEPETAYDIYQYQVMLQAFIKELGIVNPFIVGHSFGGRICLVHAAKEDVAGVIITGGAGIKPVRPLKQKLAVLNYKFMKLLVKTPLYSQYKEDLFATSGSVDYKNASPIMKQVLVKTVNEDLTYTLPLIEANTLLVWGELDDATPLKDGELMHQLIAKSELIVYPGCGHYAFLENIDDFNGQLGKFIKKYM